MQLDLECVDVIDHTITGKDNPKQGEIVKRITFLDTDRKDMCRAFFSLDVDRATEIQRGQKRQIGMTSLSVFNGTAYIKGTLHPLAGK